jgi:hypothetical protein
MPHDSANPDYGAKALAKARFCPDFSVEAGRTDGGTRNLPEGNPLKDKPAYQAVAKRHYVRVPRIISITRPDQVLGFGGSDFSPETIQQRADEGYKQTEKALQADNPPS